MSLAVFHCAPPHCARRLDALAKKVADPTPESGRPSADPIFAHGGCDYHLLLAPGDQSYTGGEPRPAYRVRQPVKSRGKAEPRRDAKDLRGERRRSGNLR